MDDNFKKHKKRAQIFWLVKSLIIGVSAAMFTIGVVLLGTCFAKVNLFWAWYLLIGIGAIAICGGISAWFLRVTDQSLAHELDQKVDRERVQTALAYRESEGGVYELQRKDVSDRLSSVRIDFKPLWVYILVIVLSFAIFLSGILCTLLIDRDEPTHAPVDNPYFIDEWQHDRLADLITYVQESDADEYTKIGVVSELMKLISLENMGVTESQIGPFVRDAITKIRSTYAEANSAYPDDDVATDAQKQQKKTNYNVGEYVVKELHKIFPDVVVEGLDGEENPGDSSGGGDEKPENPNQGGNVSGSKQLFFDPERGYVYYDEIAQKYHNEINNALNGELVSSDDWFDIVLLYFQYLDGARN